MYDAYLKVFQPFLTQKIYQSDDEIQRETDVNDLEYDDQNAEATHIAGYTKHLQMAHVEMTTFQGTQQSNSAMVHKGCLMIF